jgi:hypothetical protein
LSFALDLFCVFCDVEPPQVPLTVQSVGSSAIAIIISLAHPAGVYVCARTILERVKDQIAAIDMEARAAIGEKRRTTLDKAREKAATKLADHPDAKEKRILICGVRSTLLNSRYASHNPSKPTGPNCSHMHSFRRYTAART